MPIVPGRPTAPYPDAVTRGSRPNVAPQFVLAAAADLHEVGMLTEFDPEGSGYDYATANKSGLGPDDTGHWPSRDPESGLILKGRGHPTFNLTEEGEAKAGYTIRRREDGRYISEKNPE